jgi:hypothetical protein
MTGSDGPEANAKLAFAEWQLLVKSCRQRAT